MSHGHVTPNKDGSKARCGGPGICSECSRELASTKTKAAAHPPRVFVTQNVYIYPRAPEAHYEQAGKDYEQREEYLSLQEHTALTSALEEEVGRLHEKIADLVKFAPGQGKENSFQEGTRAAQMQDALMEVLRAGRAAHD